MTEQKHTDPNLLLLGQVAVTAILWAGTFVMTKSEWLTRQESLPTRVALVVVGTAGFLPVVYIYAKSIRMQDEFNQRIHLIALAVAFALVAVISYTCDLLHQARFIPQLPATGLWALMVVIWFVTMIVTPRYYR
jgi:hypothetical protein